VKILVTGGTGFTGSALSQRLARLGNEVVVLDNKPGLYDQELRDLGVTIHYGTVADRSLVDRLVSGCEQVYHLAAAFRLVNLGKQAYWDINVNGTKNIMDAAQMHGVQKVINCSTCGVHGNISASPAGETAPIAPADYYQYTKWKSEELAMQRVQAGQWVTTLRPTAIYGPGDPERFFLIF